MSVPQSLNLSFSSFTRAGRVIAQNKKLIPTRLIVFIICLARAVSMRRDVDVKGV